MSFRDRFKAKQKQLMRQHVRQTQNKDQKSSFPTIIKKPQLPAGMEIWQCKEGQHIIDVIPFFAGPDFPLDPDTGKPAVEEGDPAYVLDLMVHTNVGSMKTPFVCPYENFGLPCPICEFMKENDLDVEDWKTIKAKRRVLYLVWVHDSRETTKKGIQLWEISHFSMEEKLAEIAALPKGGGAINFADPYEGKSIAFTRKGSGRNNTQYLGHRFIDREIRIPELLLDKVEKIQVDQLIHMHPTYEDIEEAFKGQRMKISSTSEVDDAGSAFDGNSPDTGDIPDWMSDNEEKEEKKTTKKTGTKKKIFRKKK